jgi:alpha-ribazole phosphatase
VTNATVIHTMRHAHTEFNEQKRYAGSIDISINERGKREISGIKKSFDQLSFDIVITSCLKRSIETANLLIDDKTMIKKTSLVNERCFGIMEGKTWDEVQNLNPAILFIEVGDDLHSVNPKDGEPFEDVWYRAKRFKNYLLDRRRGCSILVISHGVFLQMFHGVLNGLSCIESLAEYPGNLEMNVFQFENKDLKSHTVQNFYNKAEVGW